MKTSITNNRIFKFVIVSVVWLAVWQLIHQLVGYDILVPAPLSVAKELFSLVQTTNFWLTIYISTRNILIGFFITFLLGTGLAILSYLSKWFFTFLNPIIQILKAVPQASFIILALVWVKSYHLSIFIVVMMVTPVIFSSVYEGLQATDPKLLTMTKLYRFGTLKTLRYLYLPSLTPFFLSAYKSGFGMAFKSAIAAEVIGVVAGSIGQKIYLSKLYLETTSLFAWTIAIILFSFLAETLGLFLTDTIAKKRREKGVD